MRINPTMQILPNQQLSNINKNIKNDKDSFGEILKNNLNKVNELQIKADVETQNLITGQATDLHSVLIATEEAKLALETTVQIRNKVIEAYQEINRMQI